MTAKLLLVHGAWHNAKGFASLQKELNALGIESNTVELSSAAKSGDLIGDMYGDAEIVRSAAKNLGDDVYVLAHSYGGLPITQGLTELPSVRGLIYLTAFMLDEGETLFGACGGQAPPWWVYSADNTRLTTQNPGSVFYNTCSAEIKTSAISELRTQSLISFNQEITDIAWKKIDSTYIICEQDQAIPLFAQEAMSQRANQVMRIDTDHSPFLCKPKELSEMLEEILKK